MAANTAPLDVGGIEGTGRNQTTSIGGSLRTVIPSPYNDRAHLTPVEYEDHDGGPWGKTPRVRPVFKPVPNKWVVAPALGSAAPAVCVFPRRLSNNVSFSPEVHLSFAACWTPVIARFSELYLTDVDKKGNMPTYNQEQHWVCSFNGKTSTGTTSVKLRIRVNNSGDLLEGWALYLPDTDHVLQFGDFPAPPSARVGFDSSSAVVVNGALTAFDPEDVKVVFSKLDESVERETRVKRATQAWRLFVQDVKRRSTTTIESINSIRNAVYYSYFANQPLEQDFWQVVSAMPASRLTAQHTHSVSLTRHFLVCCVFSGPGARPRVKMFATDRDAHGKGDG